MLKPEERQTIMDNIVALSDEEAVSYLISYASNAGDFDRGWHIMQLLRTDVLARMKKGQ